MLKRQATKEVSADDGPRSTGTKEGWHTDVVVAIVLTILLCVVAIGVAAPTSNHSQGFDVTCNAISVSIFLNSGPLHIRWHASAGASARVWLSTQPSDGPVAPWNSTVVYYALGPSTGLALTLANASVEAGRYYIACLGVGSSPASNVIGAVS